MIKTSKIKTYSIKSRASKVNKRDFARKPAKAKSFIAFLDSLPDILKARDLRAVASDIVSARRKNKGVIFMAGAHVIKCGLNPVLIELMKKGVITCICLNGAGIIHDFEIAFMGKTSEDVEKNLKSGTFGMGRETADFLTRAATEGAGKGFGLGYAVGRAIAAAKLANKIASLLYNAYTHKVPVCVFVGIGTDIIHQHPSFDAAATAQGSMRDFHTLVENICSLNQGGVALNFGSAVLLPEAFLKALNLARNLGNPVSNFTTANFDTVSISAQSKCCDPADALGGQGVYIIGHHEIMLPLLAQSVIEKI